MYNQRMRGLLLLGTAFFCTGWTAHSECLVFSGKISSDPKAPQYRITALIDPFIVPEEPNSWSRSYDLTGHRSKVTISVQGGKEFLAHHSGPITFIIEQRGGYGTIVLDVALPRTIHIRTGGPPFLFEGFSIPQPSRAVSLLPKDQPIFSSSLLQAPSVTQGTLESLSSCKSGPPANLNSEPTSIDWTGTGPPVKLGAAYFPEAADRLLADYLNGVTRLRQRRPPTPEDLAERQGYNEDNSFDYKDVMQNRQLHPSGAVLAKMTRVYRAEVLQCRTPGRECDLNDLSYVRRLITDGTRAEQASDPLCPRFEARSHDEETFVAVWLQAILIQAACRGTAPAEPGSHCNSKAVVKAYEEVIRQGEQILGLRDLALVVPLEALGIIIEPWQPSKAYGLYGRALDILVEHFGEGDERVLTLRQSIGLNEPNYGNAIDQFNKACVAYEKKGQLDASALQWFRIARAHLKNGDTARARVALNHALNQWTKAKGPGSPEVASCRRRLRRLDPDYASQVAVLNGDSTGTALLNGDSTMAYLAQAFYSTEDPGRVILADPKGEDIRLAMWPELLGNPGQLYTYYSGLVPAELSIFNSVCRADTCWTAAYGKLLREKGAVLESFRRNGPTPMSEMSNEQLDALAKLQQKWRDFRTRASSFQLDANTDRANFVAAITDLYEQSTLIYSPVRGTFLDSLDRHKNDPLSFRTLLRPDEALIDIYRFRQWDGNGFGQVRYLAFVTVGGADPKRLVFPAPAGEIDQAVINLIDEINGGVAEPAPSILQKLRQLIWEPILAQLAPQTKYLWVSGDSELNAVPWYGMNWNSGRRISVSLIPSPLQFVSLRKTPSPPTTWHAPVLLVGGIEYGGGVKYLPIPKSSDEVQWIAETANQRHFSTFVLRGSEVTKDRLISEISAASYVHLATHASVLTGKSAPTDSKRLLADSGIAVTGANSGKPGTVVLAEDLINIPMGQCRLVVISACDSGLGLDLSGQGLLGLQTAFLAAGARAMLISLWKVDDTATAELMDSFYQFLWLKGETPERALEHAQEKLRGNGKKFAEWGAWQIVGESW